MDFTVSFLPVLFITGALTALFLLLAIAVQQPASARDRIRNLTSTSNQPEGPVNRNVEKPLRDRIFKPVLSGIGVAAEKIGLAGDARLVQEKLANAGSPRFLGALLGVREYVALKLVSLVLAGLVLIYLLRNPLMDGLAGVMAMMLIVLVIGMAPTLILDRLVDARKAKISRSLPDVLDLLVVSAEAGLSLDAAMTRVAEKRQGPLSEEFLEALQEMRLGKSRADALRDMANRCGVKEVRMVTGSIIQAERMGVGIAQVLRTQADTHRLRRSQKVREQAAKLPVKMIFPMIFFIFPALFLVVAYPGMVMLMRALGGDS